MQTGSDINWCCDWWSQCMLNDQLHFSDTIDCLNALIKINILSCWLRHSIFSSSTCRQTWYSRAKQRESTVWYLSPIKSCFSSENLSHRLVGSDVRSLNCARIFVIFAKQRVQWLHCNDEKCIAFVNFLAWRFLIADTNYHEVHMLSLY